MDVSILLLLVVGAVTLVLAGVHVAVALGLVSILAVGLLSGFGVAFDLLATTFYRGLQVYEFGVVPLFVLMGVILASTRLSGEIFEAAARLLVKVPGSLAVATVVGNAGFSAVTGTSIASAAAFSGIAYGPCVERGYDRRLVLGSVAGSSVLGMLIPPSILLILYGVLTESSIGALFMAGLLPGLTLALIYIVGIIVVARLRPDLVGNAAAAASSQARQLPTVPVPVGEAAAAGDADGDAVAARPLAPSDHIRDAAAIDGADTVADESSSPSSSGEAPAAPAWQVILRPWPIALLAVTVLGGIYRGLFTATEAGAIGAIGALAIAGARGELSRERFRHVLIRTGVTTASLMFVIVAAQLYARVLAMTGFVGQIASWIQSLEIASLLVVALFVGLIIVMGMLLDSTSILLLIVPVAYPVLTQMGYDPIWLGVVLVIAIEVGLITPPLGLVAYTVKSSLGDQVTLEEIFAGSLPFVVMMLLFLALVVLVPELSLALIN